MLTIYVLHALRLHLERCIFSVSFTIIPTYMAPESDHCGLFQVFCLDKGNWQSIYQCWQMGALGNLWLLLMGMYYVIGNYLLCYYCRITMVSSDSRYNEIDALCRYFYFDGLVQDCSTSSALAIELLQSSTKPSICCLLWMSCRKSPNYSSTHPTHLPPVNIPNDW